MKILGNINEYIIHDFNIEDKGQIRNIRRLGKYIYEELYGMSYEQITNSKEEEQLEYLFKEYYK